MAKARAAPPSVAGSGFVLAPGLAGLVIVVAAALAYHNTFSVPFLFDDQASILGNPTLQSLVTAWTPPAGGGVTVSGRPLLNFTLALNHAISGTDVWSYHLFNLLIHAAAGCTLFGVVRRTLENVGRDRLIPPSGKVGVGFQTDAMSPRWKSATTLARSAHSTSSGQAIAPKSQDATWLALAVALLWTLHPLQTQAVTYIIQRAESLAGLLQQLTLWCFIRSVEPGAARWWSLLTWTVCLLGMTAKETMVTAPVLVVLYDRIFVAGSWPEVWARRRGRHLELAATWLMLLWLVLETGGRDGTAGFGGGVSPWSYALTQIGAVGLYLRLAFWPDPLVFDYGRELAQGWDAVWLPALVLFPLLAASVWAAGRGRVAGFLGVSFFLLLAPSSSFVPVLTQTMGEHRVYLPLAAVVTLVVGGLHAWWGRRSLVVFAALAVGLGVATVRRNHDYRSGQALWEDTVAKRPDNPRALVTLSIIHENEGRLDVALPLLERAVALEPDYAEAQNNLGSVLVELGRPEQALECFMRALASAPGQPTIYHNLGALLQEIGRIPEAIQAWEEALRLDPDQLPTLSALAATLAGQGRLAEAAAHYVRYLAARPDDAEARGSYAGVLLALSRTTEALAETEAAVRLRPGSAELHNQVGRDPRPDRTPGRSACAVRGGRAAPARFHRRARERRAGDAGAGSSVGRDLVCVGLSLVDRPGPLAQLPLSRTHAEETSNSSNAAGTERWSPLSTAATSVGVETDAHPLNDPVEMRLTCGRFQGPS